MSDSTRWLLLFHILGALWLAGGSFASSVVRAQVKRAENLREKAMGLRILWRLTTIYTLPGAVVAGILGFALIVPSGHTMRDAWVQVSQTLWLVMLGIAIFYLAPRLKRTLAAAEASLVAGVPTPELVALAGAKLPGILADVNALGIVVLTALMVIQP
jgi:uncharacterized membrane protein